MREKINGFHVALLIYMIEIDVTIFSVPRVVAENIGTNGWVAILLLSSIAVFNICLYQILFRVGEGRSAFELLEGVFPKGLLVPFYLGLSFFWIALGAIVGKNFILLFQIFTFQTTNSNMIYLLYCVIIFALLSKDIYSIIKAVSVFFLLSFSLFALIPYFLREWKLIRFTTSFFQGTEHGHSIHGWLQVFMVFVGYEIILFLFPDLDKKGKVFKGVYWGHAGATFVQFVVVIISFGFFSFQEVQALQYPMINTMEYIELPFINRLENLIFTLFLFANIVSTVMFCYAGQLTLKRVVPKIKDKRRVAVVAAIVFGVGFFFQVVRDVERWLERGFFTEMALSFAMPLVLIPVALYSNKKRKGIDHEAA